jgi:hypothetical protein
MTSIPSKEPRMLRISPPALRLAALLVAVLAAAVTVSALLAGPLGVLAFAKIGIIFACFVVINLGTRCLLPAVFLIGGDIAIFGGVGIFRRYLCIGTFDLGNIANDTTYIAVWGLLLALAGAFAVVVAALLVIVKLWRFGPGTAFPPDRSQ